MVKDSPYPPLRFDLPFGLPASSTCSSIAQLKPADKILQHQRQDTEKIGMKARHNSKHQLFLTFPKAQIWFWTSKLPARRQAW